MPDTAAFKNLYTEVTDVLTTAATPGTVVETLEGPAIVSPVHGEWLRLTIATFEQSYAEWGTSPNYATFRDSARELQSADDALWVSVCAHLHIVYDLPQALAVGLSAALAGIAEPQEAILFRRTARALFLGLAPRFRVAVANARLPCEMRLLRKFRQDWLFQDWVTSRRNWAWIQAEVLTDSDDQQANALRLGLLSRVNADLVRAVQDARGPCGLRKALRLLAAWKLGIATFLVVALPSLLRQIEIRRTAGLSCSAYSGDDSRLTQYRCVLELVVKFCIPAMQHASVATVIIVGALLALRLVDRIRSARAFWRKTSV